ncbi:MAG: ATP-binding protein [Candidatus Kerfeldbacteria bacterium]|nr:ATP-binding protein [Candidatus Kerfeldbacteria bacterium]
MNTETLKEIILEQTEELQQMDSPLIEREQFSSVLKNAPLPHVVTIAGIRRCGKSTLLLQTMKRLQANSYYCNFEDERFVDFTVNDFNTLYEVFVQLHGEQNIFFFDEIQNIPGWERFVRRMYNNGHKFYVTGSNAALLSKEFSTKLTGRHVTVPLYPFSFNEFLDFHKQKWSKKDFQYTKRRAILLGLFEKYMEEGGMPEYLKYHNTNVLTEVYNDILYRDIVARYEIKEVKVLRELALYLLSNVATQFSYNALKKMLQLGSMNTVKSYIEYLENSFLFSTVNQFDYSLKKQQFAPKKIYCIDTSFINTIAFKHSENEGHILENIVYMALRRNKEDIFYYRTEKGKEVDFLIRKGTKPTLLIQVALNLASAKTKERELSALIEAMDEWKMKTGYILTKNTTDTIKQNGKTIYILPVYQWLLSL